MQPQDRCWIFGDEAGEIGRDQFFAIGILGTREPRAVVQELKKIREKTKFTGEISYKSPDNRRALCAVRWMDWLFSGQQIAHFRIVLKNRSKFQAEYFRDNVFDAGHRQLAYCESYREVLCNFADYSQCQKVLTYSQISLEKMDVAQYLEGRVPGFRADECFQGNPKEYRPHGKDFTARAELLQYCDLMTSSFVGLCNAVNNVGNNKDWVKKMLQLNLMYHVPTIKDRITAQGNIYHPVFLPYDQQVFSVFYWRPR